MENMVKASELAQLALDVYNDPDDNDLRKNSFNKCWIKMDSWPKSLGLSMNSISRAQKAPPNGKNDQDRFSGFFSQYYLNNITGVGVIAIRGTDSFLDFLEAEILKYENGR